MAYTDRKQKTKYRCRDCDNRRRKAPQRRSKIREAESKYFRTNPAKRMLKGARVRAKRDGLSYSLSSISIPAVCPVLGIPLLVGNKRGPCDHSPTLDRFDNTRGYTPDNVRVISWRANRIKNDATADELRKVLAYVENTG